MNNSAALVCQGLEVGPVWFCDGHAGWAACGSNCMASRSFRGVRRGVPLHGALLAEDGLDAVEQLLGKRVEGLGVIDVIPGGQGDDVQVGFRGNARRFRRERMRWTR